jgi:hypothetical protein
LVKTRINTLTQHTLFLVFIYSHTPLVTLTRSEQGICLACTFVQYKNFLEQNVEHLKGDLFNARE